MWANNIRTLFSDILFYISASMCFAAESISPLFTDLAIICTCVNYKYSSYITVKQNLVHTIQFSKYVAALIQWLVCSLAYVKLPRESSVAQGVAT